jgi:hypothetical protein
MLLIFALIFANWQYKRALKKDHLKEFIDFLDFILKKYAPRKNVTVYLRITFNLIFLISHFYTGSPQILLLRLVSTEIFCWIMLPTVTPYIKLM